MKHKDTPFKVKIILSYLTLLLAIVFIAWLIFSRIVPLVIDENDRKEQVFDKVIVTGTILSSLYESELYSMALIQNRTLENKKHYDRSMQEVFKNIDSLASITDLPSQQSILQKLLQQLHKKNKNLSRIMAINSHENEEEAIMESLSALLRFSTDSMTEKIIIRENILYDTLLPVVTEKENFWKRLGAVFSSSKPDTIVHSKVRHSYVKDTIRATQNVNIYDTVINIVEKVIDSVYLAKERARLTVNKNLKAVLMTDMSINKEINILLNELQREAVSTTMADISAKQNALNNSGTIILIVALFALVSMVILIIFIFNDVNKSKAYRKELEIARENAENLMQSRERLLLTISHDLKAPLSSIAGYIELMHAAPLHGEEREYIDSMNTSISHVMELLNNLLEYARLDAGKTVLVPEVFSLSLLFEEAAKLFYPLCQKKNLSFTLNNDIAPDLFVESDRVRLQQILSNLLSNAVKFTDQGGITLSAAMVEKYKEPWLRFSVKDSGCGIAPEKANAVFEAFSRIDNHQNKEGSGFGLFIVKRTVDLFHGYITVTKNKPAGAVFTVQIPLQAVAAPQIIEKQEYEPVRNEITKSHILVVDDEAAQLKLMEKILTNAGHAVDTSNNIEKAVALLSERHVDLLITDIQLNHSDGFQLLEMVKNATDPVVRNMPVIAVSANEAFTKDDFLRKGFSGFLKKPFAIKQLQRLLQPFFDTDDSYRLNNLMALMDDDVEAVQQILMAFVSSGKESITAVIKNMECENFYEIKQLAHKMLPMVHQLEMEKIAQILSFLESCDMEKVNRDLLKERVLLLVEKTEKVLKKMEADLSDNK